MGYQSDRGGFQRRSRDFDSRGPREMFDAVCAKCNKPTKVPFKPTEGRPVYCRDCYAEQRSNY